MSNIDRHMIVMMSGMYCACGVLMCDWQDEAFISSLQIINFHVIKLSTVFFVTLELITIAKWFRECSYGHRDLDTELNWLILLQFISYNLNRV